MTEPVVNIKQGDLRGKYYKSVNGTNFYGFLGIPYAAPPVGDLRFKAPVPPASWTGIRDATQEGNICCQVDLTVNVGSINGAEDCLFLNVFTPTLKIDDKPLPVIVYIHGGGFINGSKDSSLQGPHYLIEQEVVVVSINYRLGIFGFLNLDLPGAQGNMGLKDQVQALRWVQDNISKFNGDASNVTVHGISAGGASVHYLCLSQMTDGLFNKAIIQSGCSLNYWANGKMSKDLAFSIAEKQGKEVTDTTMLLEYLKGVPASELTMLALRSIPPDGRKGGFSFEFVPSVEKIFPNQQAFISEESFEILRRGEFKKIPYIIGFCRNEGIMVYAKYLRIKEKIVKDKDFLSLLPFSLNNEEENSIKERLKAIYIDTIKPGDEENNFAIDFFTDLSFLGGIYTAAKLMATNSSSVYFYEFAYDGALNYMKKLIQVQRPGACHGDDGGYIYHSLFLPSDCSDIDKLVRDQMVKMWTNFAKYGNPTPETTKLLPTIWKPITKDSMEYLIIDGNLTLAEDLAPLRTTFFEDLYLSFQHLNE